MAKVINPRKYQVSRREGPELDPESFFVLKRGDVLAVAALRSYMANILTILELEAAVVEWQLDPATREKLGQLADYVHDLALEWEEHATMKLPD